MGDGRWNTNFPNFDLRSAISQMAHHAAGATARIAPHVRYERRAVVATLAAARRRIYMSQSSDVWRW